MYTQPLTAFMEVFVLLTLSRDEKRALKDYLFRSLDILSEYRPDLRPNKRDSLETLMKRYFYWADVFNAAYLPEREMLGASRQVDYLVQRFDEHMRLPVAVRY